MQLNGSLYFFEHDGTADALWRTDGTAAGTVTVRAFDSPIPWATHLMANVNGTLYFAAADGDFGSELWKSDGTPGGTVMVKDINTAPGEGSSPGGFVAMGGAVYFGASDPAHGFELWRTDGTAGGTRLVKDVVPGTADGFAGASPIIVGTNLFFIGTDTNSDHSAVWKSDGTAGGTVRVFGTNDTGLITVDKLVALGNTLYFMGSGTDWTTHLWRSDGTTAGTARVSDMATYFTPLEVVNGALYFTGIQPSPRELFRSDGTAAGTVQVTDLASSSPTPEGIQWVNGRLVFLAGDGEMANLYASDGTPGGTHLITRFADTTVFPTRFPVDPVTGRWYFVASNALGFQLWATDGTAAGTARLTNLPGGLGYGMDVRPVGSDVYFVVDDPSMGKELWRLTGADIAQALAGPTFATGLFIQDHAAAPNFVRLFDADTTTEMATARVYEDAPFPSAVRLARADFDGDGTLDVVTGPASGPVSVPRVRVLSGSDGSALAEFLAFDAGFLSGMNVAVGDVTGDGRPEVIVAADAGAGPHVKVFDFATRQQIASFWAFDPAFAGGVCVAAADFDGDGRDDVIASAGPGAGPHVKVFDARDLPADAPRELVSFWAGDLNHHGGVTVAGGDITGDGRDDIVTGVAGDARVFDATSFAATAQPAPARAYAANTGSPFTSVRVAVGDVNADGRADVLTAPGRFADIRVRLFSGTDDALLGEVVAVGPIGLGFDIQISA